MTEDNASAGARGDRCGYATADGEPCELPPSRSDDRCHLHTDVDEQAPGDDEVALEDYDAMLSTLDVAIETAREKINNGRIRDVDKEKTRIQWVRAMAYAMNVRRQITADRDLEEVQERLERLEEHYDVEL
ncbi:hypothetical protein SAMN05443574_1359 [Haloarcula vallismortis]|uniref:DUF8136 domain-containing protein n=2 Tax=Haloarcula vallismortis TaxID=28442 RepID=M0J8F5_HALVA|nr:hypothetical protein [Haloarcula vallismortis]EMA04284.1 hypothetical protein C437_14027 [Haloarcula vallismortis ATCC 29715]SDX35384.1 hypothetical protein SAMN05443574_1359 [Haloarcula vallismortis]